MNDAYQALLEEELKMMLEEKSYLVSRYREALELIVSMPNVASIETASRLAKKALEG